MGKYSMDWKPDLPAPAKETSPGEWRMGPTGWVQGKAPKRALREEWVREHPTPAQGNHTFNQEEPIVCGRWSL